MDLKRFVPGDPALIDKIVNFTKANGIFDKLRQECLADVDTKSSCQNLSQRIDGYTSKFLANQDWNPDLNKNELRNNLRRHIDESGILALGADIVVEQVFNLKVDQSFYPIISEVTHRYIKEQSEPETTASSLVSEKITSDVSDNKDKTHKSDPIADILSFSYSKPTHSSVTNIHVKTENVQPKHSDVSKIEVKKEDKNALITEKSMLDVQSEPIITSVNEAKIQLEKDKIKKEDPETQQENFKKIIKDEVKVEKKKTDDVKVPLSEITTVHDKSKSSVPIPLPASVSTKKDDKSKHKSKSQNIPKASSSSSETKKPKKESSEKINKSKTPKSSKDASSPTKISSSLKSVFKEEKKESPKPKTHDADSNKTPETPVKKTKSGFGKNESSSSKHKKPNEKSDKDKISKSTDKSDPHIHHDSSNSEKSSKSIQYSSSYDSSQGSDQEKNTSIISNKERPKHFSKHANNEKSEHLDISNETDKKRPSGSDENSFRKYKNEKDVKLKLKDTSASVEAAKINSRSNSFGSTSSVSSSSNASKDNSTSNSDETSENSMKDKKKKQLKEKDPCQTFPKTLPPPPPPPPPSSSLTSELTSSAEMSSVEDTQSSIDDSETSSSEKISDESSSDSELESKDLINDTLNENELNSSTDNINAFYDIFLYSSSSSEFEGYSPQKSNTFENKSKNIHEKDLSISSVHTSDLSSFDDELSCDEDDSFLSGNTAKKLTLKEAQELMEKRIRLNAQKKVESNSHVGENSLSKRESQKSTSFLSSDDESVPSERKRSLRRERKLNPRYSSSEYTSIFNYKKETFITRQTNFTAKSPNSTCSPESKLKKSEFLTENNKLANKSLKESKTVEIHPDKTEISKNINNTFKKESQKKDDPLNEMSSSDEMDSVMEEEIISKQNNKRNLSDEDRTDDRKKFKSLSNSKVKRNSHSLKHKLEVTESTPVKRPCSRSSVDSSSSEFAPNENKPFNSENTDLHEEKKLKDNNLKLSNLTMGTKKELFCKQKTINNGNILGQKDVLSKNLHGKVINNGEKKTSETDGSKELSSL